MRAQLNLSQGLDEALRLSLTAKLADVDKLYPVKSLDRFIEFAEINGLLKIDILERQQSADRLLYALLHVFAVVIAGHPDLCGHKDRHIIDVFDFNDRANRAFILKIGQEIRFQHVA